MPGVTPGCASGMRRAGCVSRRMNSVPITMPPTVPPDSRFHTGIVTFLFTDVEGSTTLWERDPDAMQAALAHHDRLLRRAIESAGGCIVKSTGDGVYAVFATATDALAACLAAQRSLQKPGASASNATPRATETHIQLPLGVRMGLHTGVAESRDGDYFGGVLNRAARIMSAAHGGQVLLSAATAEVVRAHLPEGVALREMGEHRLKGLLNPERLLQVVASDLRADFPPLASLTGHSLPAERDAFVGRRESLAELARRLDGGARLVSVLGLGGTGKTRLVTRFGWNSLGDFPGGVWFCDLSEARSLDGVLQAVAQGLNVPLGKDDPVTQLGNAIAGHGKCLVILDNFEQVVIHAEETLGRWLDRASGALFLVTTREVLGLPGEETMALAPLTRTDAAELFLQRAAAAKPGFEAERRRSVGDRPSGEAARRSATGDRARGGAGTGDAPEDAAVAHERAVQAALIGWRPRGPAGDLARGIRLVLGPAVYSRESRARPDVSVRGRIHTRIGGGRTRPVRVRERAVAHGCAALVGTEVPGQAGDRQSVRSSGERSGICGRAIAHAMRYEGSGPLALVAAETRHGGHFAGLDEKAAVADGFAELDNLVVACRRAVARGDVDTAVRSLEGAWAGLGSRGPFQVGAQLASMVQAMPEIRTAAAARVNYIAGCALEHSGKRF